MLSACISLSTYRPFVGVNINSRLSIELSVGIIYFSLFTILARMYAYENYAVTKKNNVNLFFYSSYNIFIYSLPTRSFFNVCYVEINTV